MAQQYQFLREKLVRSLFLSMPDYLSQQAVLDDIKFISREEKNFSSSTYYT